ncbi:putative kinase inhibitor [Vibrio quintilis]|uniref:Putative kinase inhibitor n=1 Tax=Vibrio quintilis TaxID=1117707 RepID=A0A1M7YUZ5_9VIBR|nr:putative kinase inhibitor [Vibrio quintilis]
MKRKMSLLFAGLVMVSSCLQAFELTSSDIQEGESLSSSFMFNGFGCSGKNVSPHLS